MDKQPQKYLKTRATLSPWQITGTSQSGFTAAIIIPALAERESLPATLASLCLNPAACLAQTLVVIVINNRADISPESLADNQKTLSWLRSNPYPQLNLAWIDASSSGLELPVQDGVGLARKIGFDASLPLLAWEIDPLLISLDADTLVDQHYLPTIFDHFTLSTQGAVVIPFRHQANPSPRQEAAIRHYELYLRSYLLGLQLAGSPYAYHSIGSAFACRAETYVKAGGMNRRCGGEDFYFLQQLGKISGIEMVGGTVVRPSPRFSSRVPFGTGKAVQLQVEEGIAQFRFIPVQGFQMLQEWLVLIERHWEQSASQISQQALTVSPVLDEFLTELKFSQIWEKLQKNHSSRQQRLTAFHRWFDALRTRQLLTRSEHPASFSAEQIVAQLLAWRGYAGIEKGAAQLALLERLQGV